MDKPIIALTMGDPAGIGPELVVKALSRESIKEVCRLVVVGDAGVFQRTAQQLKSPIHFCAVPNLAAASYAWPQIDLLVPQGVETQTVILGKVDPELGRAAGLCLQQAAELAAAGKVQGVVSAPLHKEAFHLAGFQYRDELAFMAELTGSPATNIIGVMEGVWTITVTEHIAFKEIADEIKKENILNRIRALQGVLAAGLGRPPRIGVAALNPHAGDGGLMGREEIDEIRPAVEQAIAEGLDVSGPIPADMVFVLALQGGFDGVVCMYHDQANIARKLQPKDKGATLFMGLPFPCATTAHGTAFDKAGLGIADTGSFDLALWLVSQLAAKRA